jgi:hypothetical protein
LAVSPVSTQVIYRPSHLPSPSEFCGCATNIHLQPRSRVLVGRACVVLIRPHFFRVDHISYRCMGPCILSLRVPLPIHPRYQLASGDAMSVSRPFGIKSDEVTATSAVTLIVLATCHRRLTTYQQRSILLIVRYTAHQKHSAR